MNWKLLVLLSLLSVAMSFITVFHLFDSSVEQVVWLLILIFCAVVIARNAPGKLFMHGFLLCLINAVWQIIVHVALFDTFIAHNADSVEKFKSIPLDPHTLMFVFSIFTGIVSGVLTGLLAMLAGKFITPRAAQTA
jgi:hypothetical protein